MISRERVQAALNHHEPDQIPLDLGASSVTGMHVSSVYRLRQTLGLDVPGTPVKVIEPYQLLGEIAPDLSEALGVDAVGLSGSRTIFGFRNENWKPWALPDGTPVLIPEAFNTEPEPNGDILMYPEGDRSAPPSGRMPKGGFYFDTIIRQEPIDDDRLSPEDNLQEFQPICDEELQYIKTQAEILAGSGKAVLASLGGAAFGDIALVPAPWLKHPKGIRDVAEWYMSTASRRDFVYEVFERQCEIALTNWEKIHSVAGEVISAVYVTGTDFGTQQGPFISLKAYRDLYKPFHRIVNDWVHTHTSWKTFIHSCGSVRVFLEDFIEAGFDVLNPVQCSAVHMDPRELKMRFGDRIVFWGGGVDTQMTLPFGTPEQIREEVRERIQIFGPGGGFVFNTTHNVQAGIPIENLVALYQTFKEFRRYPL